MLQWKYVCIGTDPVNIYWSYTVIIETMNVLGITTTNFFFSKSETIFGYTMLKCCIKN